MEVFAIVKVLVVNDAGGMLALQRDPHDFNRPGQWDFPGGNVDKGEEFVAAARRETKEETGIQIQNPVLVYATTAENPKGSGNWLFFLEKVQGRPAVRLSKEHVAYQWVPIRKFLERTVYERHIELLRYILAHKILERV